MNKTSLIGFLLSFFLLFLIFSCSQNPAIIRKIYPLIQTNNTISTNYGSPDFLSQTKDGLTLDLGFINRNNLYKLARANNKNFAGDRTLPLLSVFRLQIQNNSPDDIQLDLKDIVITASDNSSIPILDMDSFKTLYPNLFDQTHEYSFLFYTNIIYTNKGKSSPLFKSGTISPSETKESILVFPFINEMTHTMTLKITNISFLKDKKRTLKKDFSFQILQTITRYEEKKK